MAIVAGEVVVGVKFWLSAVNDNHGKVSYRPKVFQLVYRGAGLLSSHARKIHESPCLVRCSLSFLCRSEARSTCGLPFFSQCHSSRLRI